MGENGGAAFPPIKISTNFLLGFDRDFKTYRSYLCQIIILCIIIGYVRISVIGYVSVSGAICRKSDHRRIDFLTLSPFSTSGFIETDFHINFRVQS
jgi:hypothetical protein